MKLFQTAQNEVINISTITNIKPLNNREIGEESERLYTKDEYKRIACSKDVKKVRVANQDVLWSQVDVPVVAYRVTTMNGSVVISVPDYERLMKILSSWLTADDEHYNDKPLEAVDEHTSNDCPLTQAVFYGAPDDIEYAAMDRNGEVYWYKEKPLMYGEDMVWNVPDRDGVFPRTPNWTRSCIKRKR